MKNLEAIRKIDALEKRFKDLFKELEGFKAEFAPAKKKKITKTKK